MAHGVQGLVCWEFGQRGENLGKVAMGKRDEKSECEWELQ